MRKKRNESQKSKCSQCGALEVINVRRDRVYKGVLIENIPATYCLNCSEELYDLVTVRTMEQIAAEPETYAPLVKRHVARVA